MRNAFRLLVALGLSAGLGACGHTVALTPLDGGQPARGQALSSRSAIALRVDGKVYRGHWRTDDAPFDPRAADPVPPGPVAVGRFFGQRGAGGQQVAELTAKDGSTIACRFRYERGMAVGDGLCRSDTGRSFSLRLY
jgi:hypothetical protein